MGIGPSQSAVQAGFRFRGVEPKLVIRNDLGSLDGPHAFRYFFDGNDAARILFAERDLPAGTDGLNFLRHDCMIADSACNMVGGARYGVGWAEEMCGAVSVFPGGWFGFGRGVSPS